MNRSRSFVRLRASVIARSVSALLLVLVVLPFTAPFSTFDIAELLGDTPVQCQLGSSAKTVKHALAVEGVSNPLDVLFGLELQFLVIPARVEPRQVSQFVLRI